MTQSMTKVFGNLQQKTEDWRLKLEENNTSALLYVNIKQSRLKISRYLPLFLSRFDVLIWNMNAFP